MNLPRWLTEFIRLRIARRILSRAPDFIIGGDERPYLMRWFVIPRNRLFNVYAHMLLRDDDDRALHDHPWPWVSIILQGRYAEHSIRAGGIHVRRVYEAGSIRAHLPWYAHRLEMLTQPGENACVTLFITGPRVRTWGFHCPKGWVSFKRFTDPETNGATVGRGCDG